MNFGTFSGISSKTWNLQSSQPSEFLRATALMYALILLGKNRVNNVSVEVVHSSGSCLVSVIGLT